MSRKPIFTIDHIKSQIEDAFCILTKDKFNEIDSLMIKYFLQILFLFILVFVPSYFLSAQNPEQMLKLQLAQGFEESGEWERAVSLYEDLTALEPNNFIFLDGLQRSYTQIKEYKKAINVIRRRLILQPRNITLMTTLGGLYYDSGNE